MSGVRRGRSAMVGSGIVRGMRRYADPFGIVAVVQRRMVVVLVMPEPYPGTGKRVDRSRSRWLRKRKSKAA